MKSVFEKIKLLIPCTVNLINTDAHKNKMTSSDIKRQEIKL